jgi:hypothetical protein
MLLKFTTELQQASNEEIKTTCLLFSMKNELKNQKHLRRMSFSSYFDRNRDRQDHYQSLPINMNKMDMTSSNARFDNNITEDQICDTVLAVLEPAQGPPGDVCHK